MHGIKSGQAIGRLLLELEFGGIAQLGERLHGMQEVSGSIPLTSTKNRPRSSRRKSSRDEGLSPLRLEA